MAVSTVETIQKLKFKLPPQHTGQISPHMITIFLDHSKRSYMDANLQIIKKEVRDSV